MKLARLLRSAFVVGRRDFTATVMSKAFLLFLLGPLFPLAMGMLFGGIGANVASEADRSTVAVSPPLPNSRPWPKPIGRWARHFRTPRSPASSGSIPGATWRPSGASCSSRASVRSLPSRPISPEARA